MAQFGGVDKDAYEMLGYEDDVEDEGDDEFNLDNEEEFEKFKTKTRKDTAQASEVQR